MMKASSLIVCVLLSQCTVEGTHKLIWKPYFKKVPEDCNSPIPGQTALFVGQVIYSLPGYNISGVFPTTIVDRFSYVNVTIGTQAYLVPTEDAEVKVLCSIESTDDTLDYVTTSTDEFTSLFDTKTKPIPIGWEYNHHGNLEEKWYNATLYAGVIEFDSSEGSHRVAVGKVYENANEELDHKLFYANLANELSATSYDVLTVKTL